MAKVTGTPNDDVLPGTSGNDFIYGYGGSDTLSGGDGDDNLYGVDGTDTLFGGAGNDNMDGGAGADFMAGGLGNDTYVVDDLGDVVSEASGEGIDTVKSFLFEYRLTANVENLVLSLAGAQNGRGNDLDNRIKGNDFVNQVFGLGGNDIIFTYGGNDVINPGTGKDAIDGGAGVDIVTYRVGATHGVNIDLGASDFGTATPHVVYTYADGTTDTLIVRNVENAEGTQFNDVLTGDAGANKLIGGAGDDEFRGRGGNDDMSGGAGVDTFVFERAGAANGVDIVREYQSGEILRFFESDGYDPNAGFTLSNTGAVGAGPQFVYNTARELFYDADGAGGAAAIKIASILGDPLTAAGIQVVNDGVVPL